MSHVKLQVPFEFRRGVLRGDERASVDSGIRLIEIISSHTEITGKTILDYGCGVKLAQALIEVGSPHKSYTGLDVYADMINYMNSALVHASKFHFVHVDFQNEMYNKDGDKMTTLSELPIPRMTFDILAMFSVVTHMPPADAEAILSVLRRYASANSNLIFSAFVDERQSSDFLDEDPDNPLLRARYKRAFLEQIIERCRWKIESFNERVPKLINYHYVCSPA